MDCSSSSPAGPCRLGSPSRKPCCFYPPWPPGSGCRLFRITAAQAIAAAVAHAALFLLFGQAFKLAANPFRPLTDIVHFMVTRGAGFINRTYLTPALTGKVDSKDTAAGAVETPLKVIDFLTPDNNLIDRGISGFARRGLIPSFAVIFSGVYALLATSFSTALLMIEKAWGPQFEGITQTGNFFDYFYFSLLSQATAIPSGVHPITVFGKIWMVWIVLTGLLILAVLLTFIATTVGMQREQVNNINILLSQQRDILLNWEKTLSPTESHPTTGSEVVPINPGK